jgi:hypothetical protein
MASVTLVPRRRSLVGPPVIVAASAVPAGTMASAAVAPMMDLRSCM